MTFVVVEIFSTVKRCFPLLGASAQPGFAWLRFTARNA